MLKWFRKLIEFIKGEADEFIEFRGENACPATRATHGGYEYKHEKFLNRANQKIAKPIDNEIVLDIATQDVEKQMPYEAGPGFVINRPGDSTLH